VEGRPSQHVTGTQLISPHFEPTEQPLCQALVEVKNGVLACMVVKIGFFRNRLIGLGKFINRILTSQSAYRWPRAQSVPLMV
jgi:hypothetical protein